MTISMGLHDPDDILLTEWNASILALEVTIVLLPFFVLKLLLKAPFEGRLFELRVTCGPQYPDAPPLVRFVHKINLQCVDQRTGIVNVQQVVPQWQRSMTIESVLVAIQRTMVNPHNRRLPQPAEGEMF